jgi:hypothetical protein
MRRVLRQLVRKEFCHEKSDCLQSAVPIEALQMTVKSAITAPLRPDFCANYFSVCLHLATHRSA